MKKTFYLLNYMINFIYIYKKNVAHDDVKSHQKSGFTLPLKNHRETSPTPSPKKKKIEIWSLSYINLKVKSLV